MDRPLPALNALRAFEAVGRNRSFRQAAEELHVTPGAVSRQLKLLEAMMGITLLTRSTREVRLTVEGAAYLTELTPIFRRLESVTTRLWEAHARQPLRVMCSMNVATRWLFPRLLRFHLRHPQVQISLTTTLTPAATPLEADTADVVIRLGTARWPAGIVSHRLFDSELVPICSPGLLARGPKLTKPEDLSSHTLLSSAQRPDLWHRWIVAAGMPEMPLEELREFESTALVYEAAAEGFGVALAEKALISEEIQKGRLVMPLSISCRGSEGFFLLYRRSMEDDPRLRTFCAWILQNRNLVRAV